MTKIFITGIGGLLGCTFTQKLLTSGNYEIHGCDTFIGGIKDNIPKFMSIDSLIQINPNLPAYPF